MTADLTIRVDEIRAALGRVLDVVQDRHGPDLVLADDYYWSVPVAAAFDMTRPDPKLTVGQISEDIDAVRELGRASEVVSAWHELAHLVGVLRAVEALDRP
ncbi:hypothetical protein BH10ACT8_BH10ACT8_09620 [soil metagenome]